MKKEYDFSQMKGRKNPYAKRLKKQVTIRMGIDIIEPRKRAHSPQLAAGLASVSENGNFLTVEDSLQLAAGNLQYFKKMSEESGIPKPY